jgi:hypothetical protein
MRSVLVTLGISALLCATALMGGPAPVLAGDCTCPDSKSMGTFCGRELTGDCNPQGIYSCAEAAPSGKDHAAKLVADCTKYYPGKKNAICVVEDDKTTCSPGR